MKRLLALKAMIVAFGRTNALFFEQLMTFGVPVVLLAMASAHGGVFSAFVMFSVLGAGYGVGSHIMQQRYEKLCAEYQRLITKSQQKADDALALVEEMRRREPEEPAP